MRKNVKLYTAAIQGTSLLAKLLFLLALARNSNTKVIGAYGLAVSIESLSIYLAGFEFHTFTARRYGRHRGTTTAESITAANIYAGWFFAILAFLISALLSTLFRLSEFPSTIILLSLSISFSTVSQEIGRYLILKERPAASLLVGFCRTSLWQIAVLPFIENDILMPQRLFIFWFLGASASLTYGWLLTKAHIKTKLSLKRKYIFEGIRQSRIYYALSCATIMQDNASRFTLQGVLGPQSLGVFTFYQTLCNTITSICQASVLNIALPHILKEFGGRKPARFTLLRKTCTQSTAVSLIFGFVVLALSPYIAEFTGKSEILSRWEILPILVVAQILTMTTQPLHLALYAASKDRQIAVLTILSMITSLVLNVLLVTSLGVLGAALSYLISAAILSTARIGLTLKLRAQCSI